MKSFRDLSILHRLALIAAIPALGAGILALGTVRQLDDTRTEDARLVETTALSSRIGDAIHQFQRERGLSAAFVASKGKAFAAELPDQRDKSDAAQRALAVAMAAQRPSFDADTRAQAATLDAALAQLANIRSAVSGLAIPAPEVAKRYSAIVGAAIKVTERLANGGHQADGMQRQSLRELIEAKEYAGRERAAGAGAFAAGKFTVETYRQFAGLIALENEELGEVRDHASPAAKAALAAALASEASRTLEHLRVVADRGMAAGSLPSGERQRWWDAATQRVDDFKKIEDQIAAEILARAQAGQAEAQFWLYAMIATLVAAGVLVAGAVWWIARGIIVPLRAIDSTMCAMAEGRLDEEDGLTESGDELGQVSRSVRAFRVQLRRARDERDAQEREKHAQAEEIVSSIGAGLNALSDGDLTHSVDKELSGTFAPLRRDFNAALAQLRDLVGSVIERAHQLRTGAGEIANASEDLACRTERNAATIEQTSAALVNMDQRLQASARAAKDTVAKADVAIGAVEKGRSVAGDASSAMNRVSESAQAIDGVIEGLDKIAFQTRVLAMNAAVEAGRAGEAGRGFAVVADLVSALAMRAEEQAKTAREQLTVTQADIGDAVAAVKQVDQALDSINEGVGSVFALVETMAADNQAQAGTISEITAAVSTLDQATQQNAAMVEESSAASRTLNEELNAMGEEIARFRIERSAAPTGRRATLRAVATLH